MSNIFQPLVRNTGGVIPLNAGVGPIVDPVIFQGLKIDATGAVYAVLNGAINHYSSALPFDINGRLVFSNDGPPSYVDQSIPFTATGTLNFGGVKSYIGQGIAYDAAGLLATS